MCDFHWKRVPKELRDEVLKNYRDGQCDDKKPSQEWKDAAQKTIDFVEENL